MTFSMMAPVQPWICNIHAIGGAGARAGARGAAAHRRGARHVNGAPRNAARTKLDRRRCAGMANARGRQLA
ncbi:hypothetical protein predicted by Glimmer/Critica [Bordetella petrii]|uniref:Uncharacterized protein n=1 Tax=Bordetella petrii (strain ATCC BAA-461 / DSM 12804 / CCUG 43448 / CIP 107267 / Se-1111R) TaxID=340100 RepID=A9HZU9_BORPD|nr:hypothetical protein predicted by Glimmer/Critica [Bordetella petrii]